MEQPVSTGLTVNGASVPMPADPDRTLLDVLRADLGLTGAKYGCGLAQCGACTVLVDGAPARACVLRARHAAGRRITTLEGLAGPDGELHPVQAAFVECQGAQCGYCLNGMILTAVALLERTARPDEAEVRAALRHNLCRCGAHSEMLAAVMRAAARAGGA